MTFTDPTWRSSWKSKNKCKSNIILKTNKCENVLTCKEGSQALIWSYFKCSFTHFMQLQSITRGATNGKAFSWFTLHRSEQHIWVLCRCLIDSSNPSNLNDSKWKFQEDLREDAGVLYVCLHPQICLILTYGLMCCCHMTPSLSGSHIILLFRCVSNGALL